MALSSARFEGVVNPASGIFVEMEGIMQVEYTADNPNFAMPSEDLYSFQQRNRRIPKEFCLKNRQQGGRQAVFQCLVCEGSGPLKSILPLQHHVVGKKHIRKACEAKRRMMGIPKPSSVIEKKKKKVAKSPPKKNVNLSLAVKLETSGQPALGLEHITEFLHPEKLEKNYPMYSCSLEGCKSAWGTSFEIFHHVLNAKHQKNFLKSINPNDATIGDMPKSDILLKAMQWEEQEFPNGEKDYSKIVQVIDHDQYMEMRERRPLKPLEGEKVLEGEGEKVLETEIKTDFFRVFGVNDHDQYMEMPLEGEKVLETEIKTESKTEIRVTQEKVLETEIKTEIRMPQEMADDNDFLQQVATERGSYNGDDYENNIIPEGGVGIGTGGGFEDQAPNLEEEKMGD